MKIEGEKQDIFLKNLECLASDFVGLAKDSTPLLACRAWAGSATRPV